MTNYKPRIPKKCFEKRGSTQIRKQGNEIWVRKKKSKEEKI